MPTTVIATFNDKGTAEKAVGELRNQGFDNEISIVAKGQSGDHKYDMNNTFFGTDSIANGTTTGGILGGLAGLALGAGALAIPGIGPIVAAGPIAGALSGAATGGIAGGLADFGIPAERGKYYEDKVKEGKIVASVQTSEDKVEQAAQTLRQNGAQDVETH
ncbi:hypothetical protein [Desulfolucanica intricata]|uniref:hypothetical protein n=1 Tax=Desulfolucanica intricata TaxID=1285191 RepID=UPI00082CBC1D|nr:hypothetical protein [Desulfolucanica intricata]